MGWQGTLFTGTPSPEEIEVEELEDHAEDDCDRALVSDNEPAGATEDDIGDLGRRRRKVLLKEHEHAW